MSQAIRADDQLDNSMSRLLEADGSVNLAGNLDLGGFDLTNAGTITGLSSTPASDDEVASKGYVDGVAEGLDIKESVRVATDGTDLVLDGSDSDTIDGVTVVAGDRILAKDQSTASENGIYVVDSVNSSQITVSRAADFDEDSEVTAGAFTFVAEGTSNGDNGYVVTSDDPIAVGTDPINFTQFSGAGQIAAGAGLTKSGNTIDFVAGDDSLTVNADDALVNVSTTLETYSSSGVGLASVAAGSIFVGQGTSTEPSAQTVGGDVTMDSSASVTVQDAGEGTIESSGTGIRVGDDVAVMGQTDAANMYFHRQLSGGAREVQKGEYDLDHTPDTGVDGNHALVILVNGLVQEEGEDYTVEGTKIDFGQGVNTTQPSDTSTPNPASDVSALWYKSETTSGGV